MINRAPIECWRADLPPTAPRASTGSALPLRELELDAAVATVGFVGLLDSIGWNSPKPAATSRCGDTPRPTRYCTTEIARAAESSQLLLNWGLLIGRTSVWPSTRKHPGDLAWNSPLQLEQRGGELVELGASLRLG